MTDDREKMLADAWGKALDRAKELEAQIEVLRADLYAALKREEAVKEANEALKQRIRNIADQIKPPFAMCYDDKNYFKLELSYELNETLIERGGK